jgi:MraZ protein
MPQDSPPLGGTTPSAGLILGEYSRTLDDRFRLTLPPELAAELGPEGEDCILAKERPGCLSLWRATVWQERLDQGVDLVRAKIRAGKMEGRFHQVQLLGRLLSSRHKSVQLAARGRLLLPEGFREFLRCEAGSDVMVIGAAVCVELWNPAAWNKHLDRQMPRFRRLLDRLSD